MEEPKPDVAQEKPKASVVGWVEPSNCLTRRWSGLEDQFCERIASSFFGFFPSLIAVLLRVASLTPVPTAA